MIRRFLSISLLFALVLILSANCSAPKFTPLPNEALKESIQISLMLAVSDTVFSYSAVKAYYAGLDLVHVPEIVKDDSVGPLLHLWIYNRGPGVLLPLGPRDYQLDVDIKGRGYRSTLEVVYSLDGEEFDYSVFSRDLRTPVRLPCAGYTKLLRFVNAGESVPLAYPIDFMGLLPLNSIKPGEYEVGVVLQSVCDGKSEEPLWKGKVLSNRIRFRIAGN